MNKTKKYITAAILFVTAINGAYAQSSDSANGGVWDKTKKVTGDVWDGAKEVGSDIKEGLDGSNGQNTDKNNDKPNNQ